MVMLTMMMMMMMMTATMFNFSQGIGREQMVRLCLWLQRQQSAKDLDALCGQQGLEKKKKQGCSTPHFLPSFLLEIEHLDDLG